MSAYDDHLDNYGDPGPYEEIIDGADFSDVLDAESEQELKDAFKAGPVDPVAVTEAAFNAVGQTALNFAAIAYELGYAVGRSGEETPNPFAEVVL